ncbi:MAG: DUF1003 domain-containing protein [Bdellovibrionota bacterium]
MENKNQCLVCKKEFSHSELLPFEMLNESVAKLIETDHPHQQKQAWICKSDANHYRMQYVRKAVQQDIGEISELEQQVIESIKEHELIADNVNDQFEEKLTFGEHLADQVASFGGSWKFIILFSMIIVTWITLNVWITAVKPFDPYPFILLNLVLSCLAALQAPIIMMSQNRQNIKDRLRADSDYKINLKSELEIRHMKAKLDQLSSHQWKRLLEIQELQMELLRDHPHLK